MDRRWYQDSDISNSVKTYATRLARLHFLQHTCSDNHTILITERHLIEIACSKLQEALLKTFSLDEITQMRAYIVWWIKSIARVRVYSHVSDGKIQNVVASSINNDKLNDLFKLHGH
jgi:hypothetical protein